MKGINKVFLRGFLEGNVYLRYFGAGIATAQFSIVTPEEYIHPKTKQKTISTQTHKILVNDFKLAEFCEATLQEGMWVSVEGKLINRYSEEMGLPRTDTYIYAHTVEPKTPNSS